jgi:Predicted hydrolase of the HD superfamily (permuted catalytic motifs)
VNLVLLRTEGNQRFIFASNKRQEIVGASELIARLDRIWVLEELQNLFPEFDRSWRIGKGDDAELLVAGAGTATVLVKDKELAKKLVTQVTSRALREAPGLDVCGVVVPYGPSGKGLRLADAYSKAQRQLGMVRGDRPGPQVRFRRLPLIAECASNGLPAAEVRWEADEKTYQPRSAVAVAKLDAFRSSAFGRLAQAADMPPETMQAIVKRLSFEVDWVAVVHADGNRLGGLFKGLQGRSERDRPEEVSDEEYAARVRCLSAAVDACARRAFKTALGRTREDLKDSGADEGVLLDGQPPVVPLVLGGDDLTVVCDGRVALTFTRHYLEAFEETTTGHEDIRRVVGDGLTAAAGVAIVKQKYPFHFAYDLCEELMNREAKAVKDTGSALAFAVLLDSAAADLTRLRAPYGPSVSPYLVGKAAKRADARVQRWEELERRVEALRRRGPDGELLIPRGVAHDLREGLVLSEEGRNVAESRLQQLRRRYAEESDRLSVLDTLAEPLAGLPDAMAALAFLPARKA